MGEKNILQHQMVADFGIKCRSAVYDIFTMSLKRCASYDVIPNTAHHYYHYFVAICMDTALKVVHYNVLNKVSLWSFHNVGTTHQISD